MGDSPDSTDALPWESDGGNEREVMMPAPTSAELEEAGQESMFGDTGENLEKERVGAPEIPTQPAGKPGSTDAAEPSLDPVQPYRVLARKYRPQTFAELIGQEAMVRTLANAIARDRLAHAFLMTGVRGVGKTSTARLIAKALNCIGPDGEGGPTINPCGVCEPCRAIAEGRHIDVIEMDAASHTGVDDVREIIEAVRYAAVSARYKIYIIDEVHMLSRNAFNALLKTLEEPPAHVKFLFATTEVDKLPVTVLSRTQRFDLRRIPTEMLQSHFAEICAKESVQADDEALHIIASAAEGSVRDGLSILDQAIAHADLEAEGRVTAARVRDMLGLADKSAQRRLFGHVLEGDAKALLLAVDEQYAFGVEPLALVRSLMDLVHRVALAQVSGGEAPGTTAEERDQLSQWAEALSPGQVHRLWQLLLKGHDEVRQGPDPLVSARMALLRVLFAADMPDPGKLAKRLENLTLEPAKSANLRPSGADAATADSPPATQALDWAELVAKVENAGQPLASSIMRLQVRPVAVEPGRLRFSRAAQFTDDIGPTLRDALLTATGQRWAVEEDRAAEGAPSLVEREESERAAAEAATRDHPLVRAAFEAFPEAELVEVNDAPARREIPWSRKA